ncbi:MAG: PHB accumulation regulatory domain-containing protein, partial [Alphaproteobacteria bacterium]
QKSGHNLLPIGFLRQLIGFYGDNLQWLVPRYLEASMQTFARNQEQFRSYMQGAFGNFFPFGRIEEMGKQNLAMLERAMQMWTPFSGAAGGRPQGEPPPAPDARPPETIRDLQARVDALQKQLEALSSRDDGKGGR